MRRYCFSYVGSRIFVASVGAFFISSDVFSLPEGGQVVQGQASIESSQNSMTIHQHSQRSVINYQDFSIAENETVNILQPDAQAALLNRVIGQNVSEIYGNLNANGRVFLINQSGIIFGEGSQVNVGSLMASSLSLSDEDFMQGRMHFSNSGGAGQIENYGQINAQGDVIFIAPSFVNEGEINAEGGDVAIANDVQYLRQRPGSLIGVLIESDEQGTLENRGVIRATNVESRGGDIYLSGSDRSDILNEGLLDASAVSENNDGGDITLQANRVAQLGEVHADALGDGDGGDIYFYGWSTVSLGDDSFTSANAGIRGTGGEVIALSPDTTLFRIGANIEALGGTVSGNGGYVDVSGHQHVEAFGNVDVMAFNGEHGTFLVDPLDLTIATMDNNVTAGSPFQPTATGSLLNLSTLNAALTGGANVEVRTDVAGAENGDIIITNVGIDYNGNNGGSLSFIASGTIIFTANSWIGDSVGGDDAIDITMTAGGALILNENVTIETSGGNFVAGVGGNFRFDGTDPTSYIDSGAGTIDITTGGNFLIGSIRSSSTSTNAITLDLGGQAFDGSNSTNQILAPNGGLNVVNTGNFRDGSSDGIETNIANLTLTSRNGEVRIDNIAPLNVLDLSGIGNLTLTTTAGDIQLSGDIDTDGANGGTYTFSPATSMTINAGVSISDQATASSDSIAFVANATTFTMIDTSEIRVSGGTVDITTTAGDLQVSDIITTGTSSTAVDLNIAGDLIQVGDATPDIEVYNGGLNIVATGNIPSASSLEISATSLNLSLSGGTASIIESTDLDITGVSGVSALSVTSTTGDLNITGNIDLDGANGNAYTFNANQDINFSTNITIEDQTTATTDDVNITLIAGNDLVMADGSSVNASGGTISVTTTGLFDAANLTSTSTSATAIDLNIGTDIDDAGDADVDLVAASGGIRIIAGGNVASPDNLEINPGTLNLSLSGGNAYISSWSSVDITGTTGVGDLQVRTFGASDSITVSGNIDLDGSSNVMLYSSNDLLVQSGVLIQDSNTGTADTTNIELYAENDITMQNTSVVDATDGTILVNADADASSAGNVWLSNVVTTSTSSTAITIRGNEVFDNGSAHTDIIAQNGGVSIRTVGNIGNASFLETDINALDITITGAGNARIVENDDLRITGLSGVSNFDLFANSGTVTIPDAGLSITGNLELLANDLVDDSGRDLIIAAQDAFLGINNFGANTIINSDFQRLDLGAGGIGLEVINANALELIDSLADADSNTVNFSTLAMTVRTTSGDLTVSESINLNGADGSILTLGTGTGGDIIFAAGTSIQDQDATVVDSVNIQLLSDSDVIMDDNSFIDASAGTISMTAVDRLTVGGLRTNSTSASAITLNLRGINDAGNTFVDIVAPAGGLDVTTTDNITFVNGLETELASITIDSGGSVNIAEADDLIVNSVSNVDSLRLNIASGNLTIPDAGISVTGDLDILTTDIMDVSGRDLNLSANDAYLNITNLTADTNIISTFARFDGNVSGNVNFTLSNGAALELFDSTNDANTSAFTFSGGNRTLLTTVGDLSVSNDIDFDGADGTTFTLNSAADILLANNINLQDQSTASPDDVDLVLIAGNEVDMLDQTLIDVAGGTISVTSGGPFDIGGLVTTNTSATAVNINSSNVVDAGDFYMDIDASLGGINIVATGNIAATSGLETNTVQIAIDTSGDVIINETDDLIVNAANNINDLTLDVSGGNLTLPDAGITTTGDMIISAQDLQDVSGRDINLSATDAYLNISALTADTSVASSFQTLDMNVAGSGNFTTTNDVALILSDNAADADTNTMDITSGNAIIRTTTGNLTVNNSIDLDGANGNTLTLDAAGDLLFAGGIAIQDQNTGSTDDVNIILLAGNEVDMPNQTLIDAAGGTISVTSGGLFDIGGLVSTNTSATAIDIDSFNVTTAGEFYTDLVAPLGGIRIVATADIAPIRGLDTDTMQMSLDASGDVIILEADDLNLVAVNNINNLTLDVSGGVLTLPDAGITTVGNTSILAQDIQDVSGRDLNLTATDAYLNISALTADTSITSSIQTLDINVAGSGNITLTNDAALILSDNTADANTNSVGITSGNATIRTTTGNLTVSNNIDLDGANGNTLTLDAAGDLTFATGTSVEDQNLATADNTDIFLNAGNDISFNTTQSLNAGTGLIQISAVGQAQVSNIISNSIFTNAIQINAGSIQGDNTTGVDLQADNGGIVLTTTAGSIEGSGGMPIDLQTPLLALDIGGGAAVNIRHMTDLTLGSIVGLNAGTFAIGGVLTIPDIGMTSATGLLEITAQDIIDSDRNLNINANQLLMTIGNAAGNSQFNTSVDELDVSFTGGSLNVTETAGLTFRDLNSDGNALSIADGNASAVVSTGDLNFENNASVNDISADGVRTGLIEFISQTGNISIGAASDVQIISGNTVDQNVDGGLGNGFGGNPSQTSVRFELANNAALSRTISIGNELGNTTEIIAVGGDIEIDGLGSGVADVLNTTVVQLASAASLESYNVDTDANDGVVYLNNTATVSSADVIARTGRAISIRPDGFQISTPMPTPIPTVEPTPMPTVQPTPMPTMAPIPGAIPDDELTGIVANDRQAEDAIAEESSAVGEVERYVDSDVAYSLVFGACDTPEERKRRSCQLESTMKAFLHHWTVGGQLPKVSKD